MKVPKRQPPLAVAIPASLVSELGNLREKTHAIGRVGRSAAIFRVDEVVIYPDSPDESNLVRLILSYMETPQYLRRLLFKKREELRYVGVLPPLRTPHHPLESRATELEVGEFREGVVLSEEEGEYLVEVGVEVPLRATGRAPSVGSRATVRITAKEPSLLGRFVGRGEVDGYWGYGVQSSGRGLAKLLLGGEYDLKVATSRMGSPYAGVEGDLGKRWKGAKRVLVAFGSPRHGLDELLGGEGSRFEEDFDFIINTIPHQGCETVRTEEALQATLAVLNLFDG